MTQRIFVLGFWLALVVTPAWGAAGFENCPPCCDHVSEAHCDDEPGCASLRVQACCHAAPIAALASEAQTTPQAASHFALAASPPGAAAPAFAVARPAHAVVRWWTRPSRLSVVRRL